MFGYVIANAKALTQEEGQAYQACYCGVCKALTRRHGAISGITLTYDMAFLVLLLTSVYDQTPDTGKSRCLPHPLRPHRYWTGDTVDYAADMNLALSYYKFLDDWQDEKKPLRLAEAKAFERESGKVAALYPRQCGAIKSCLKDLSLMEKADERNPDLPAKCFGALMGELFVFKEDELAPLLWDFGAALGRFIYIMDACVDLREDLKRQRYNPLVATPPDSFKDILNVLMGACTQAYNRLPIGRNKRLMDNILYSGVWTKYEIQQKRQGKEAKQP